MIGASISDTKEVLDSWNKNHPSSHLTNTHFLWVTQGHIVGTETIGSDFKSKISPKCL